MKRLIHLFVIGGILSGCSSSKKSSVAISSEDARKNIAKYEKAAAGKPADVKALFKLAQAQTATGQLESALQVLDDIFAIDPNFANAYLLKATVHHKKSATAEELRTYLALLNLPHGHNYLETISQQVGMPYAIKTVNVGSGNNAVGKFSPDGQHIVWQSDRDGDWNIYMAAPDGSGTQALTFAKGDDESPVFSPDNKFVAFTSHRDELEPKALGDEKREIYIYDLYARNERRLTENKVDDWAPIFYPDSSTITYVSEEGAADSVKFIDRISRLFTLHEANGNTSLLVGDQHDNTSPGKLTDGRLTWVQIKDGHYTIMVSKAGEEPEVLYSSANPIGGLSPSPDGVSLAFFMKANENIDIYRLDIAEKQAIRLTAALSRDLYPAFAPDGSQIMFSSDRHGKLGLFLLDLREPISRNELRTRMESLLDQLEMKQGIE